MHWVTFLARLLLAAALALVPCLHSTQALAEGSSPQQIAVSQLFLPGVTSRLGPGHAVRSAYDTLVEFAALKQVYMIRVVKAFTNDYQGQLLEPVPTHYQVDRLLALQADLWSRQSEVERAIAVIEASHAGRTASATVSSQGIGSSMKGFWDYLSGAGERSRNRVLTVASNYTAAQRQRLYGELRPEWQSRASGSEDFWQRFEAGEFDSQAPQIFNDLYHLDGDFGIDAMDRDLTIQHIVHREGAEGVSKGAELMVEVVKAATPLGEGMDLVEEARNYAENIETALTDPKQYIKDEVKAAIASKLAGFVDIDGLVDSGALSQTAAEAIKILTDVCFDSDDPADWFGDAIDWGIGRLYDTNQAGNPADIAIGENKDGSDLVQTMISLLGTTNLVGHKEVTIGVPGGEWAMTAVNVEGNTDSVEAYIAEDESTLVVASTEPEGGEAGHGYTLSVWISPASPGAFRDVTVYARVSPDGADCLVRFSVSGTDGYSSSGTVRTDSEGMASYFVPGAAKGVVDTITVLMVSQLLTRTVVYRFA